MSKIEKLNPTSKPPELLRALHKYYQQAPADALATEYSVLDLQTDLAETMNPTLSIAEELNRDDLQKAFMAFERPSQTCDISNAGKIKIYEHRHLPGKS